MPQELPASIKDYFAGKSRNDIDAMLVSFGEAAVVKDEGKEMRRSGSHPKLDDGDKPKVQLHR